MKMRGRGGQRWELMLSGGKATKDWETAQHVWGERETREIRRKGSPQ